MIVDLILIAVGVAIGTVSSFFSGRDWLTRRGEERRLAPKSRGSCVEMRGVDAERRLVATVSDLLTDSELLSREAVLRRV